MSPPQNTETAAPIPVLLIGCAGRSGSTLLDRVLGRHEDFCSTGELRFIWERAFSENQLCGCGQPFHDCEFWDRVSRCAFGTAPRSADVSTAVLLRRTLDETRNAPWLLGSHPSPSQGAALAIYQQSLERMYASILHVSGARVVIDSSGDGTHGLILAKAPNIALHIVHLIRDPRAVAFSWKRSRRRAEIHWKDSNMPVESAATSARRWVINNALIERLAPRAQSYRRVRYEDFVADPDAVLARIAEPYKWLERGAMRLGGRKVELQPTHTVSGNPMRFRSGPLQISLDDEWRSALSDADRRAVQALAWPLLLKYRYPLRVEARYGTAAGTTSQ
jgi:hypothetical protein